MKRFVFLALSTFTPLVAADLGSVRNVYILKMSKGLDQYLANRLTADHVFQVVTDPKMADTVLTDQIGEGFQAKLDELYPPPEPDAAPSTPPAATPTPAAPTTATPAAPAPPTAATKPDKSAKAAAEDNPLLADPMNKLANPASTSSFGRARGVVFLVDAKTKQVIWSSFDLPRDSSSKELDHTASDIVSRLKRDLNPKKK